MPQDSKASGRDHIPDFPSPAPTGVNWLLVIAIDEYEHCAKLRNCVSDAQEVVKVLTEKYGFEKTITLFNKDANYDNITDTLNDLKNKIQKDVDNLVLYFSGHGETEGNEDEQIGYLIPVEARQGRDRDYIPHLHLRSKLNLLPTRHTFVIIDACFSGTFFFNIHGKAQGSDHHPSRWGISSSSSREYAFDGKPGDNSPFAKCLIETLQENTDVLSTHGLVDRIEQKMKAQGVSQKPICLPFSDHKKYKDGQFFFQAQKNEAQEWVITEAANTAVAYHAFWKKYPDNPNAEESLWRYVCINDKLADFQLYRKTYPQGKYRFEVFDKIDDTTFANAATIPQLRSYLNIFGDDANHAMEAHERIDALLNDINSKTTAREHIAASNPSADSNAQTFGTFTDPRDGQTYKTVELNGLVWMADNLNFDIGEGSWYFENDVILGEQYGRLYTHDKARLACLPGWRLPTEMEWIALISSFGGYFDKINAEKKGKNLEKPYFDLKQYLNIKDCGGYKDGSGFNNFEDVKH